MKEQFIYQAEEVPGKRRHTACPAFAHFEFNDEAGGRQ
jgi:hypothetical protein